MGAAHCSQVSAKCDSRPGRDRDRDGRGHRQVNGRWRGDLEACVKGDLVLAWRKVGQLVAAHTRRIERALWGSLAAREVSDGNFGCVRRLASGDREVLAAHVNLATGGSPRSTATPNKVRHPVTDTGWPVVFTTETAAITEEPVTRVVEGSVNITIDAGCRMGARRGRRRGSRRGDRSRWCLAGAAADDEHAQCRAHRVVQRPFIKHSTLGGPPRLCGPPGRATGAPRQAIGNGRVGPVCRRAAHPTRRRPTWMPASQWCGQTEPMQKRRRSTVGLALLLAACSSHGRSGNTESSATAATTTIAAPGLAGLHRPLRLPAIPPGGHCPVSAPLPTADLGVMLGIGPARPVGIGPDGVLTYVAPTPGNIFDGSTWGGNKVLWAVAPGRRRRVGTRPSVGWARWARLWSGRQSRPELCSTGRDEAAIRRLAGGFPNTTRLRRPGCFALPSGHSVDVERCGIHCPLTRSSASPVPLQVLRECTSRRSRRPNPAQERHAPRVGRRFRLSASRACRATRAPRALEHPPGPHVRAAAVAAPSDAA